MNKILKYRQEVFLVILILFTVSVNSQNSNTVASKKDFLFSYLSSLDFSKGAVKLEPNLISTNQIEYNTSFDGPSQTLYYTISSSDWSQSNIMQSQFQNGKFSKPEKVKFDGQFCNCADVHIQKEGQYLYFVGDVNTGPE